MIYAIIITLLCFFPIRTRIKVNLNLFIIRLYADTIYIRLLEQSIYQIDGIILFLIDDFGVNLRHLHIGMAEQLRGSIKICSERQHHRGESVAGCMESDRHCKEKRRGED